MRSVSYHLFFMHDSETPEIYTLSLHDALPISVQASHHLLLAHGLAVEAFDQLGLRRPGHRFREPLARSEEHTSELQSRPHLVCRLLLEKKNTKLLSSNKPYTAP